MKNLGSQLPFPIDMLHILNVLNKQSTKPLNTISVEKKMNKVSMWSLDKQIHSCNSQNGHSDVWI